MVWIYLGMLTNSYLLHSFHLMAKCLTTSNFVDFVVNTHHRYVMLNTYILLPDKTLHNFFYMIYTGTRTNACLFHLGTQFTENRIEILECYFANITLICKSQPLSPILLGSKALIPLDGKRASGQTIIMLQRWFMTISCFGWSRNRWACMESHCPPYRRGSGFKKCNLRTHVTDFVHEQCFWNWSR